MFLVCFGLDAMVFFFVLSYICMSVFLSAQATLLPTLTLRQFVVSKVGFSQ